VVVDPLPVRWWCVVVVWCGSGRRPVVVCALHPVRWCVVVVLFGVVPSIRRAPDPLPVRLDAARRARSGGAYARAYIYRAAGLGTFFLNFSAFCLVGRTFVLYLHQLNKQTHTKMQFFSSIPAPVLALTFGAAFVLVSFAAAAIQTKLLK